MMTKEEKFKQIESVDANPEQLIVFSTEKPHATVKLEPAQDYRGSKLGVIEYSDEEKKSVPRRLRVEDGDYFLLERGAMLDLKNEQDKITWNWLKYHMDNYFCFSKEELTPGISSPKFYISIEQQEIRKSLKHKNNKRTAFNLVADSLQEDLYKYAKLNGTPMDKHTPEQVRDFLFELADRTPDKIIDLYTNPANQSRLTLLEMLDLKLILEKDTIYQTTDGKFLAHGEDNMLELMRDAGNKLIKELRKQLDTIKFKQS